ncbi:FUSC family protein [Microbacterium sp.]|uniref:FUSC family protein n=1 Tax=Microbacterium sp. TaxID=51671 RepID=UPI0019D3020D
MLQDAGRPSVGLSWRDVLFAGLLVAVAAAVLGASQLLIGPNTALSGYLTILFLLSVVRAASWRTRILSVAWSLSVALLGFVIGGAGLWVTLVALVVVCLLQAFVGLGEAALLTRSPVNLLAFASLNQSGAEVWHVLLGSAIGAGVILTFSAIAKSRSDKSRTSMTMRQRVSYAVATSAGALLIVVVARLTDFPYVGWVLLSFCIVVSVGADQRVTRGYLRIVGSVVGALIAVLLSMLPSPIPTVAAVVCVVLCVAYVNAGNYALFVLFLTPAVLLTTSSEHSSLMLGILRLEAVLFATAVAIVCSLAVDAVVARSVRR